MSRLQGFPKIAFPAAVILSLLLSSCNDNPEYSAFRNIDVEGWGRMDPAEFSPLEDDTAVASLRDVSLMVVLRTRPDAASKIPVTVTREYYDFPSRCDTVILSRDESSIHKTRPSAYTLEVLADTVTLLPSIQPGFTVSVAPLGDVKGVVSAGIILERVR